MESPNFGRPALPSPSARFSPLGEFISFWPLFQRCCVSEARWPWLLVIFLLSETLCGAPTICHSFVFISLKICQQIKVHVTRWFCLFVIFKPGGHRVWFMWFWAFPFTQHVEMGFCKFCSRSTKRPTSLTSSEGGGSIWWQVTNAAAALPSDGGNLQVCPVQRVMEKAKTYTKK